MQDITTLENTSLVKVKFLHVTLDCSPFKLLKGLVLKKINTVPSLSRFVRTLS